MRFKVATSPDSGDTDLHLILLGIGETAKLNEKSKIDKYGILNVDNISYFQEMIAGVREP